MEKRCYKVKELQEILGLSRASKNNKKMAYLRHFFKVKRCSICVSNIMEVHIQTPAACENDNYPINSCIIFRLKLHFLSDKMLCFFRFRIIYLKRRES